MNKKYPVMWKNENSENNIETEGLAHLLNRRNDFRTLLAAKDYATEELGSLHDYGLCLDPVNAKDVDGEEYEEYVEYYRYVLSTGGPGEEIRFYPSRTEFVFLNWFCGISFDVTKDLFFSELRDCFNDFGYFPAFR